jgi:anaerobic selenocysteine-containing dehydrogenase
VKGCSVAPADCLVLIGRRQLRSNNSWMHNLRSIVKGPVRCTLLMHPDDASVRGIDTGVDVEVTCGESRITVPLEVSDEMRPGVVSLPHGWGHSRAGSRLAVASERPGTSLNDLLGISEIDALTGVAVLNGARVVVSRSS